MNSYDTTGAIREALRIERTTDSVAAVKDAVSRSIRAVDAGVTIERTEYFNHSFAPDIVLKWDRAPVKAERYVFLRFSEEPEWIAEELSTLSKSHPLVYGLAPITEGKRAEALAQKSIESDTLVTDPQGVDRLADVSPAGIQSFVSRTLIRGGRGLVDDSRAKRATSQIAGGFEAARSADIARTRTATETAYEFLRPAESSRVLRFLLALWVVSGQQADKFPAEVLSSADPGDEGLKFLIEQEEISDHDFWRALGNQLTIERLAELGITGAPPNLQHVVRANLDRLWARAFRVRADQPRLDDTGLPFVWRMDGGLLTLAGVAFTAFLGATVDEIARVKTEGSAGVGVDELRRRARTIAVDSLELTNGERVVNYRSSDQQTDVASDEGLATVAATLGSPTVQRASFTVNDRHIEIDYPTLTASARTNARPPLTDILGVGLPLLWPLTESELAIFTEMMARAKDQQTLDLFGIDSST